MTKVLGQSYKAGAALVVEPYKNVLEDDSGDVQLESGLFCVRDTTNAGYIAPVDGTEVVFGVVGSREGDQCGVIMSGLAVTVQQTSGQTPGVGDPVFYDHATGKATTTDGGGTTPVNAVYREGIQDMNLVDEVGDITVVKGAVIDFVGGL